MARQSTAPAAFSDKPYTPIPMMPVTSNQVAAIGHDPATNTLAVSFARGPGHVYHYPDVSAELHAKFVAAASIGTFFGQHIKPLPFDKFPAPTTPEQPVAVTPASIAAKLHGHEYPLHVPKEVAAEAKAAGIVIVYGASDDLMEFDGAIRDEVGAYEGTTALVDAKGPLRDYDSVKDDGEEAVADYIERKKSARSIEAVWGPSEPDGASWAYKTEIPNATFDVMEDGEIYCRGIVFALADLPAV